MLASLPPHVPLRELAEMSARIVIDEETGQVALHVEVRIDEAEIEATNGWLLSGRGKGPIDRSENADQRALLRSFHQTSQEVVLLNQRMKAIAEKLSLDVPPERPDSLA